MPRKQRHTKPKKHSKSKKQLVISQTYTKSIKYLLNEETTHTIKKIFKLHIIFLKKSDLKQSNCFLVGKSLQITSCLKLIMKPSWSKCLIWWKINYLTYKSHPKVLISQNRTNKIAKDKWQQINAGKYNFVTTSKDMCYMRSVSKLLKLLQIFKVFFFVSEMFQRQGLKLVKLSQKRMLRNSNNMVKSTTLGYLFDTTVMHHL